MRKERCKHFNGAIHNKTCGAGVCYRELVGGDNFGWVVRLPCIPDNPLNKREVVKCQKFESMTKEEIDSQETAMLTRSKNMLLAIDLIRKAAKDSGNQAGEIQCPACLGRLRYSIAHSNGHVWGKCLTDGCLQWMM